LPPEPGSGVVDIVPMNILLSILIISRYMLISSRYSGRTQAHVRDAGTRAAGGETFLARRRTGGPSCLRAAEAARTKTPSRPCRWRSVHDSRCLRRTSDFGASVIWCTIRRGVAASCWWRTSPTLSQGRDVPRHLHRHVRRGPLLSAGGRRDGGGRHRRRIMAPCPTRRPCRARLRRRRWPQRRRAFAEPLGQVERRRSRLSPEEMKGQSRCSIICETMGSSENRDGADGAGRAKAGASRAQRR
jgi:hypothetical protein